MAVLFLPLVSGSPEFRDPTEATVFVDGSSDYFEFAPGTAYSVGTTWVITAPDGSTVAVSKSGTLNGVGAQRWLLSGAQAAGDAGAWTWTGDLDGAAADGTWTLAVVGVYESTDDPSEAFNYNPAATLAVQGRSVHFAAYGYSPSAYQTWNWHVGSWTEAHAWSDVDRPDESPAEDPQFARFFQPVEPISQSVPGTTQSQTVPSQDIDTPPLTVPSTCPVDACHEATPLATPAVPVPQTCVPPLVPLFCAGPFTVPAQDFGDAPVVCDLAGTVCIGPFNIPAQDVVRTNAITVDVAFTGVDASADPNAMEIASVGPFGITVPVPVIGDVPLLFCPDTCPVPVLPGVDTVGSLTVTVTVGSEQRSVTVPLGVSA